MKNLFNALYTSLTTKFKTGSLTMVMCAVSLGGLLSLSAYNEDRFGVAGVRQAPVFSAVGRDGSVMLPAADGGQYTLLAFWNSADGASRAACNVYDAWCTGHPGRVRFAGVNVNDDTVLAAEIMDQDGLDASRQYTLAGSQGIRVAAAYGMDAGLGAVLVDGRGRVVALNPTAGQLQELTARS